MISDYSLFKAKLIPALPFLIFQALKVRRNNPTPPAVSEHLTLGKGDKKILILGESTAAGVGASLPEFSLAGHLYDRFGPEYSFTNFGKNGLKVAEVFPNFETHLSKARSPIEGIFVFIGANDCFQITHPGKFRRHLDQLIAGLTLDFSPRWIYLADIPPVHLFPAFPRLLQTYLKRQRDFLQKEMIGLSSKNKGIVFDRLEGNFNPDFFSSDGVHPSDFGYQKIAEFAFDGLRSRLLI